MRRACSFRIDRNRDAASRKRTARDAALQTTLLQLMAVDLETADPGGLTAELDAAQAICEAVERLLDAKRNLLDGL